MKTKFTILVIFLFLFVNQLIGQITISGYAIAEDGIGIPGATVRVKGYTDIGTITDLDGKYTLSNVPAAATALVFSFVGMETLEVEISGKSTINVTLKSADVSLDEVVVMAIGISKSEKAIGYAATTISSESRTKGATISWDRDKSKKSKVDKTESSGEGSRGLSSESIVSEGVPVVVETEIASETKIISVPKSYVTSSGISSGTLTAGEINDFSKWEMWKDVTTSEFQTYQDNWKFYFKNRITAQLKNKNNLPVIGAKINLIENEKVIWSSTSDNTGKAELWGNIYTNTDLANTNISVNYNNKTYKFEDIKKFSEGINFFEIDVDCDIPQNVDIAFVVDATGSMSDEINYLQAELGDVISRVEQSNENMVFNTASVFYRDFGDSYLTLQSDFTKSIEQTISFIQNQFAGGGGDFPEAVDAGLDVAINSLTWSENATTKIIFLILDAPPHYNATVIEKLHSLMLTASEKGIRIVPVTCSGIDKDTEFLMRSMALATNGTYSFLTDDSGVGGSHIAPSTDEWKVETLNNLLIRIINQYSTVIECNKTVEENEVITDTLVVENKSEILNKENNLAQESEIIENDEETNNSDIIENDENDEEINNSDLEKEITEIEEDVLYSFKYYPNPNTGIFTIEIDGNIGEIFVTDVSGKIIQRYKTEGEERISVDITSFPSGFYFVRYFVEEDKFLDGKVIKY